MNLSPIRALNKAEVRELMYRAALEGHWLDWQNHLLPVGDPAVLGSYAYKAVRVVWYSGEFIYVEKE